MASLSQILITTFLWILTTTDALTYDPCGFENRNDELVGMIESPTHLTRDNISTYPPNQNCTWNIRFPYAYVNSVQLDFNNVSLYRKQTGCDIDVLTYNYPGHFGAPFELCDDQTNSSVVLRNTNQVTVTFYSDNISDEVKTSVKATGFKLQYKAICHENHVYEVENISRPLEPPPRSSSLANCKYRWKLKDPPATSETDLLLLKVFPSSNEWKVQDDSVPEMGVCLPYRNITIFYSPNLGYQPQETQMNFQKATEEGCGCRLRSRQCINGGRCIAKEEKFVCKCKPPFKGDTCEERIEPQGQHCAGGQDSYPGSGIIWSRTKPGETDTQPCPDATGNATRPCLLLDLVPVWGQPDLSGCVSKLFADIFSEAQILAQALHIDQSSIVNITTALTSATAMANDKKVYAGDLNAATSTLNTVAHAVSRTNADNDGLSHIAQSFGAAVGNIVDPSTCLVWRFTHKGYLENRISSLFGSLEVLSANIASKASEFLSRRRTVKTKYVSLPASISAASSNIDFEVKLIDREYTVKQWEFSGQSADSEIVLPDLVFRKAVQRTNDAYIHLYNARFTSISQLLDQTKTLQKNTGNSSSSFLNSDILSSKVLNVNEKTFRDLTDPVKIAFNLQNSSLSSNLQQQCVFLNMTATTNNRRWLQAGCWRSDVESNDSYAVCYCNHMTNFAVLMDVYDIEESIDELNSEILTYLSYAGGALSIIGCVLSIIVFEFFRLKNERVRIHEQLAVTIILVQLFFLVGIDRTEDRSVCMAMAICLHYFLIAMFCWMLVEGVHLYLMLVRVFQSGSHMKKYMAIGWGIPLVVVGISAGIFHEDYGTGSICWLTREVLLIAFVPAVGLVIVINTVVLLIVMRIMVTSLSKGSKASSEDRSSVRIGLKAAAVLLPLLGLTWMFGFLSITSDKTLIFTYLFTLFNSTQGVFFFVFHCLLSVDVQNAYDRRSRRLSHLKLTESSISKLQSRRSTDYGELSKNSTLLSEIASTLERRRSRIDSYSSIGRPQSVTFDDDVFLTQNGPITRNSFHSNRSSIHSNNNRNSFHDIVRSPPISAHEKVQDYRNNILNNSARSRGSMSSDGYLFYYGKEKKQLNENGVYDLDKNQLYATVNK